MESVKYMWSLNFTTESIIGTKYRPYFVGYTDISVWDRLSFTLSKATSHQHCLEARAHRWTSSRGKVRIFCRSSDAPGPFRALSRRPSTSSVFIYFSIALLITLISFATPARRLYSESLWWRRGEEGGAKGRGRGRGGRGAWGRGEIKNGQDGGSPWTAGSS